MKKLTAILQGCKLADKLFSLRKKEIRRKLEAAKDECEEVKVRYQLAYEQAMQKLGEDNADYGCIINTMIDAKEGILSAEATLKAIHEIESDLDSEVDVKPENE